VVGLELRPLAAIHLFVSLACFSFAALVLAVAPRTTENRLFALFTLLIGSNFFFGDVIPAFAGISSEAQPWWTIAHLALALDPLVLLLFVTRFPRRTSHVSRGYLWTLAGAAALLSLLFLVMRPRDFNLYAPSPARLLLAAYMIAAYGAVLYVLARNVTGEESLLKREQVSLMLIACGTALIPRLPKVGVEIDLYRETVASGRLLLVFFAYALVAAVAYLVYRGSERTGRPMPRAALGWMALGVALLTAPYLLATGSLQGYAESDLLRSFIISTQYPLRWTLFLAVVGYALLKYQAFDADLRLKPAARITLVTLVAGTALLGTYFLVQVMLVPVGRISFDLAPALGAFVAVALLGALLGAPGVPGLRRREGAALRSRRLEVYRNALEDVLAAGRDPASDERLRELQVLLAVTEAEHDAMVTVLTSPGRALGPRAALQEGALAAGRYRLKRPLGRGRSGRTFLATDEVQKRDVALKEVAATQGDGDTILQELRAATRIRSPHVVEVWDVVPDGAGALLVMEYAPGGDLAAHLARHAPLAPAEAARLTVQILTGLQAAHAAGLIHRDVKPANILLDGAGNAKVADFGLACAPTLEETRSGFHVAGLQPGTVRYMAPEQATGEGALTPATDVYAAAVILYEAIAGRPYLELRGRGELALRQAIATEAPLFPLPGASPGLNTALRRALAKDPKARYPTAAAFQQALLACPELATAAPPR